MKLSAKLQAIKLRQEGCGYPEIAKSIRVSKSTLSRWLKDIELTSQQKKRLQNNSTAALYISSKSQQRKRESKTKEIINDGKREFALLLKNPLFLSGLLLYWAEGDKNQQERVKFTNSDERMMILIMRWFREICIVPENKFRVALHVHDLHVRQGIVNYWSRLTKVPAEQFYKPYIKKTSLKQRKNVLYNGTCAIVIHDKNFFRKIEGWKLGLLEHFNIRP